MVASTLAPASGTGATHENEKRRKQTVERAKANHLSRQLQMRLQYARLKVDYGWQKQNLNEVENLYFHHSHQRGPKPYPSPPTMVTTTSPPVVTTASPTMTTTVSPTMVASNSHYTISTTPADPSAPSGASRGPWYQIPKEPDPPPSMISFKLGPSSLSEQLYKMSESSRGRRRNDGSPQSEDPSGSNTQPPSTSDPASGSATGTVPCNDSVPTSQSPAPAWGTAPQAPSSNHYPNVYRQPQTQPQSGTSSADNSFSYPSGSLTYDSFWSSHSHSTASRSFGTSPVGIAARAPDDASTMASDTAMSHTYQAAAAGIQGGQRRIAARATAGREG